MYYVIREVIFFKNEIFLSRPEGVNLSIAWSTEIVHPVDTKYATLMHDVRMYAPIFRYFPLLESDRQV